MGSLAFTEGFPDGLRVVYAEQLTMCGGTLDTDVSGLSLAFSGGRVGAGQTCTISVKVQAGRARALTGTSSELTSDLPVTTPGASATLTGIHEPLLVSMWFAPAVIDQGRVSRLTYRLDSFVGVAATSVSLSDRLPAGVVLADPPDAQTTCTGGTLTAAAGGSEVSYSGGTIGRGRLCTIAVDVTSTAAGSHRNSTESVTSSLGASPPAEATLTVDPAAAPGFARVFSPDTIGQGGETQIVFTVDNTANAIAMTGMAFDDPLPSGVSVADTPGASNSCGGTFSPVAGATTLGFADGVLAAGATCELRVTVRALEAGTLTYPDVTLTSSIATARAAEATLTVDPAVAPVFSKAFLPDTVDPGGVSTLTYRIDNAANLIEVGSLAFTDAFPDGLAVAGTPNGSTTCGGTFAPAVLATSLAFTGGRVAAGQSCTLSVDMQALQAGALTGASGALTSDLPVDTPGASATLTVNEAPLSVRLSFSPSTINQGGVSRLTYGLDNGAAVEATSVALSDTLPADVVLAGVPNSQTTCTGGTLTAQAGGNTITFSGGALGAGATCTIAVDVTSAAAGSHRNSTETVTSSLGASAPAEATLTVDLTPPTATWTAPTTLTVGVEITAITPASPSADIAVGGYAASGLPAGLTINVNTGIISGAPTTANANPTTATITVTDTNGNAGTVDLTLPAVGRGSQTLAGFAYSTETATAGDTLTLTAPTGAVGALSYGSSDLAICTVDSGTGALSAGGCRRLHDNGHGLRRRRTTMKPPPASPSR